MYDDSTTTEEPFDFADFNAKLLVLDVLCYDLDVLEPYELDDDAATVADDVDDEDDDVEGQDARAREYYDDLDVLPSQLSLVTELTVDTDLEIYQDLHPDWDGADDRYHPSVWDDIVALPALETVWVASPLPPHVDQALRAKGVSIESQ